MKTPKLEPGVIIETELGKVRIWGDALDRLDVQSWRNMPVRIGDRKLPPFTLRLRRDNERWIVHGFYGREDPGWHHGDRGKLERVMVAAVTEWVPRNSRQMHTWALAWISWVIASWINNGRSNLWDLPDMIADAEAINRPDLLKPMAPLIATLARDFSRVAQQIGAA